MINNTNFSKWRRISAKSIDAQFMIEMQQGLNCSPFEAEIMVEKVHELYKPLFETSLNIKPGQIQTVVLDIDVSPGVPLNQAKQKLVTITFADPISDIDTRKNGGVPELRRKRLCRVCEEAFQQGGLFTLEDLSILFNCGVRTLVNDLGALRKKHIVPPLRSTVKDIGRAVTHRHQIISLWLEGKEYSDIAYRTYHSVHSVANYVDKYKRCTALFINDFDTPTIALLVRISSPLVQEFQNIYSNVKPANHRQVEIENFLKKSNLPQTIEKKQRIL